MLSQFNPGLARSLRINDKQIVLDQEKSSPMTDIFHKRLSTIKGYGIYQSSFLGLKDSVNFLVLRIWLIDVNTGKDIAKIYKPGSSSRNSSVWLKKDMPLDESIKLEIREGFETMLDSTVEKALKGLSLI